MRKIVVLAALLVLSACGSPGVATSRDLMPQFDFYDQVDANTFKRSIVIESVTVSDAVRGKIPGHIDVSSDALHGALRDALRYSELYEKGERASYVLTAQLLDLQQPTIGFNLTASSTIHYSLRHTATDQIVFEETINIPCSKTTNDAFDGLVRARMASSCAIGENITHFIQAIARL